MSLPLAVYYNEVEECFQLEKTDIPYFNGDVFIMFSHEVSEILVQVLLVLKNKELPGLNEKSFNGWHRDSTEQKLTFYVGGRTLRVRASIQINGFQFESASIAGERNRLVEYPFDVQKLREAIIYVMGGN